MVFLDFEVIRIGVAISMFGLSSYFDLRKREVDDRLWIAFGIAAVVIMIFDFPNNSDAQLNMLISVGLAAAISYGIYYLGLIGGADMLCLITFAGLMPSFDGNILGNSVVLIHRFAPLVVLTNAVLLIPVVVFYNIARNVYRYLNNAEHVFEGFSHESTSKKLFAIVIGHKAEDPQFSFPLEKEVAGEKYFDFTIRTAETAPFERRKNVWVSSAIPFLVLMMLGFVVMLLFGDLSSIFMNAILS